MDTDIHTFAEQQQPDGTWDHVQWSSDEDHGPFDDRSYWRFGWLAGVGDDNVTPITAPRGLPENLSKLVQSSWQSAEEAGAHTPSWLTVAELATFDYDQAAGVDDETYRDMLGGSFFADLDELVEYNDDAPVRVVFWFDS